MVFTLWCLAFFAQMGARDQVVAGKMHADDRAGA